MKTKHLLTAMIASALMSTFAFADLIETKDVPGAKVSIFAGLDASGGTDVENALNTCFENNGNLLDSIGEVEFVDENNSTAVKSSKVLQTSTVFTHESSRAKALIVKLFHPDNSSEKSKRRTEIAQKSFTINYIKDNNRYYTTHNITVVEPDLDLDADGNHKAIQSYNHIVICLENISDVNEIEINGASNYLNGSRVQVSATAFTAREQVQPLN